MLWKLLLGIVLSLVSVSCAAQVVSPTYRPKLAASVGVGMNYSSGDWGGGTSIAGGPQRGAL